MTKKICVAYGLKAWISNPAGQLMSLIWYHPCDCSHLSTVGVKMLNRFPATRWPRRDVRWELCGTNFGENIPNLRVSCYNGNNDRSALVLFVQHPREQGEWLGSRANDYVKTLATLGFWLHHSLCSLGCWTNNTLAARSLSPNLTLKNKLQGNFNQNTRLFIHEYASKTPFAKWQPFCPGGDELRK